MEEWKEYKIGEIGKIITGKTPQTAIKNNYGGTIPFLTPSDDMSGKYVPHTNKTLTLQGLNEVKNCLLPQDSICVSCIGSDLGKVVKLRENTVTNQQINSIIPFEGFNADFVYYLMCLVGKELNFISKTSTAVPIVNKSTFSNYEVTIPELGIQTRIAAILSVIDDKIEVNRKINSNLEEQAKALFKSWFIDFEPFKDGNFVDSELGLIPEALPLVHIEDIPHIIEAGKRPKGGAVENGLPSIGAENIKGLGNYDYSKTKYIPVDFAKSLVKGKINGYELLIYKDGGKPGYFIPNFSIFGEGFPYEEMFINEHVFKLNLTDDGYNAFAYFFLQTKYIMNQLNSLGSKAAIPGINTKDLESLPIFKKSGKVKEFGTIALSYIKAILKNSKQNQRLAALRDSILPKLMSGKFDIEQSKLLFI